MSKKTTLISVIVIILITGITIFIMLSIKDNKETELNMNAIKTNYNLLSENVNKYNEIRNKYTEMSSVLILDEYKEHNEEYIELLNEYSKIMDSIADQVTNLKLRCNNLYLDSTVKNICGSYEITYEKLVNLYISDVKNYNNFITQFNEYKSDTLEPFTIDYEDYIDYNKDGNYEGIEIDEEN